MRSILRRRGRPRRALPGDVVIEAVSCPVHGPKKRPRVASALFSKLPASVPTWYLLYVHVCFQCGREVDMKVSWAEADGKQ